MKTLKGFNGAFPPMGEPRERGYSRGSEALANPIRCVVLAWELAFHSGVTAGSTRASPEKPASLWGFSLQACSLMALCLFLLGIRGVEPPSEGAHNFLPQVSRQWTKIKPQLVRRGVR